MRIHGIQSLILTCLYMMKLDLITKEKAKKAAEGKLTNEDFWKDYVGSINDDLETYFNKLVDQKIELARMGLYIVSQLRINFSS